MEFGFGVPSRGPLASLENLVALAQKGEELEFDIISVSDHVVVPNSIDSTYPYNESGEFVSSVSGEYMEQLITISYLAGVTSSIKLLTSVMVLPHRSPVLTAKMLATIDVLSQGTADRRLRSRLDEGRVRGDRRAAVRRAWRGRQRVPPCLQGALDQRRSVLRRRLLQLLEYQLRPQARAAAPPAVVDRRGESACSETGGAARRCLVSHLQQPRFPVGTFDQLADYMSRVRGHAQDASRDPASLDFAYSVNWYSDTEAQGADGERLLLTGSPSQIGDDIKRLENMGVNHLTLNFQGPTLEETFGQLERFTADIKPLVG